MGVRHLGLVGSCFMIHDPERWPESSHGIKSLTDSTTR